MSLLDKLLPASYKGVSFLATSFPTAGGRKIVKHSYPNSDKQNIEDLGLIPRSYSMQIVITDANRANPSESGFYIINRDALLAKLEDGEAGKLTHPLYGDIENVKVGPYTINENLTELGECKISVTFEPSEGTGIPEQLSSSLNTIEVSNAVTMAALNANVAANYETTVSFPSSYTDSLNKLNAVAAGVTDAINFVQQQADKINALSAEIQNFQNNITSLVRAPQAFADSITSLFDTINNTYPTIDATINVFAQLFDFGDDDVELNQNTASRIERAKNQKIVNDTIQTAALSYAYFNASQLTFNTVDEIDEQAAILEAQFQKLIVSTGMDDNSKQALRDMRVNVQTFFENQKLVTQQVITVFTHPTSSRLLAYQYYGSSDQGEQIAELNNTSEPNFLTGDVQVLTA